MTLMGACSAGDRGFVLARMIALSGWCARVRFGCEFWQGRKTATAHGDARLPQRKKTARGLSNSVRIIGGEWRGRRIRFPSAAELRPTPDRVRETLFNWLQGVIGGARCLDLFAGSGALGLEALSRGAAAVVFVERERRVAAALAETLARSAPPAARSSTADALSLPRPARRGPSTWSSSTRPSRRAGWLNCVHSSRTRGWLAPRAFVYLEAPRAAASPPLPAAWQQARETRPARCTACWRGARTPQRGRTAPRSERMDET